MNQSVGADGGGMRPADVGARVEVGCRVEGDRRLGGGELGGHCVLGMWCDEKVGGGASGCPSSQCCGSGWGENLK